MAAQTVYLFVQVRVKPGKFDQFIKLIEKHVAVMRLEDGLIALDLYKDVASGNICVWEVWRDRTSWDVHMANESSKAWQVVAANYVDGESITVMDEISKS
ncbi:MAG: antibiotic biosynthesis monooxygenase [Actinobacteria bacterium]|nr:antibiotic biosynthesis monooxygenase [Actinomycetota bacterium]